MQSLYARTRLVRNARLRRQTIVSRVLKYLDSTAESEGDAWIADDIRLARNAIQNAADGIRDPWGFAFWWYFGKTYRKALIVWAERDRENQRALERCAAQIAEDTQPEQLALNFYVTARAEIALPPKKPSHSVKREKRKAA